jgi:hypothetical protein
MRRVSIFIWFVMVCVLVVFGQQDAPSVRVAKISLPDPAYVGMPTDAGYISNRLQNPLSVRHDSE